MVGVGGVALVVTALVAGGAGDRADERGICVDRTTDTRLADEDLLESVGYALAYAAVGIVVLGVGYAALDLLTPGHLGKHIMAGSLNAAIVAASGILGLGFIVWAAIWHHAEASFGEALSWTIVFGLLGVVIQAVAFRLVDLVMPDDLAATAMEKAFHPATLVAASTQLSVSLIVVACIS